MKIKDTKNLLKEKAETVLDDMLEEMEEPTVEKDPAEVSAPEAAVKSDLEDEHVGENDELEPVEGKENEEAPKGVTSEVEASVEEDHASEGEEVKEVIVKEDSVEKSLEDDHIGDDSELEPDEGKENEEAEHEDEKAVDADLESEHVGEGEELEPVEGKENEEAPAKDKAEVEASLDADHAEEKKDVEGVVVKEEDISEDKLETDPAVDEAKEEYGEVSKDADIGDKDEEEKVEDTAEKVDELLKDEPESKEEESKEEEKKDEDEKKDDDKEEDKDEALKEDENLRSIFDLINTINESLTESEEPVSDKAPEEACPVKAEKEVEKSLEDEHAAEGEEVKEVIVKEEGKAPEVGDPADKNYDVDAVIKTPEVAEMGTEENEKHIEDEKKLEESAKKDEPTKKDLEAIEKGDKHVGECASGAKGVDCNGHVCKESVHYSSLKEACMLDEDYFTTDTYTIESAESKQNKLVEQVAVLMAREEGDPLYEELINAAIRLERLQEAVVAKYQGTAAEKANTIMESIFSRGKGNVNLKGAKISSGGGNIGLGAGSNSGNSNNGDITTKGSGKVDVENAEVEANKGNINAGAGSNAGDDEVSKGKKK